MKEWFGIVSTLLLALRLLERVPQLLPSDSLFRLTTTSCPHHLLLYEGMLSNSVVRWAALLAEDTQATAWSCVAISSGLLAPTVPISTLSGATHAD